VIRISGIDAPEFPEPTVATVDPSRLAPGPFNASAFHINIAIATESARTP
jgi:hypothetical protein